jgi:FolB domain-containing protein
LKGAPRIQIRGLRCQAHVGVPQSEQKARQELVIGLELEYDSRLAARRDDWPAATDYKAIADAVVELVEGRRVKLIEAVASLVADRVLEDPRVLRVRVEVGKPNALARADTVRAVLERERAPHTALVGLAASGPGRGESRARVEALLRHRHEVRAESAECADPGTAREGRALLLRTPMVLAELAGELHALASGMGAASGQARAVQVEVLVWNGDRLQDRSRRWSFLDAALEELERAEAGADGG